MADTQEARERLESAVTELATSDGWARYLESRSRFHSYSFSNVMLIALQRPDATQVAGYKAWQKLDRQVRRGERGIRILAPMVGRTDKADPASDRMVYGFRVVSVFDVAQTDGADIPSPPVALLTGDQDSGLGDKLAAFAASEGLTVETVTIDGPENGSLDREARRIVISDVLDRAAWAKTLAHECAHWTDLGPDGMVDDRAGAEIVAESVAYIVGAAVGLDTADYSPGYVLTWAKGDVAKLKALAERIDKAARPILAAVTAESEAVAA